MKMVCLVFLSKQFGRCLWFVQEVFCQNKLSSVGRMVTKIEIQGRAFLPSRRTTFLSFWFWIFMLSERHPRDFSSYMM